MNSAKRLFSLFICALILLSSVTGCKNGGNDVGETSENTSVTDAPISSESELGTETEPGTDTEPDPEPDTLTWIIEPGKFNSDSDVQPMYAENGLTLGISRFDGKYLVDFSGNIKCTDNENYMYYCDICDFIGVDPDTYKPAGHMGHGGNYFNGYIYDAETDSVWYWDFGAYSEEKNDIACSIVSEGIRRPATPEDNVINDFAFDKTGLYGIMVNSKLVVPFEYDSYVRFSSGIAAMRKDGKWAYFDSTGKMILENIYSPRDEVINENGESDSVPYLPSSGYIALNLDGKWGYADLEGNMVIDHIFEEARPVYCGKAWVKTEDGWGVIEIEKPEIITEEEAFEIMYDYFSTWKDIEKSDIILNGKGFYGCEGYGFDVKKEENDWSAGYFFVNYDGTVFSPSYYIE